MTILAVTTSENESRPLAEWGYRFACAAQDSLLVLQITEEKTETLEIQLDQATLVEEPLLRATAEILQELRISNIDHQIDQDGEQIDPDRKKKFEPAVTLKRVGHKDFCQAVLLEISSSKIKFALISVETRNHGKGKRGSLASALFTSAPCHLIMLRCGDTETTACQRILVPVAGGPNSMRSLPLAAGLAKNSGGTVAALFVQKDIGPESVDIGKLTLKQILKKVSLDHTAHVVPQVTVAKNTVRAIADIASENFDLLIIGASNIGGLRRALFSTVPDRLLGTEANLTLAVFRAEYPATHRLIALLNDWFEITVPQMSREERIELYQSLDQGSHWRFDYVALLVLSTAIATLGLIQSSTAVVIGAMLVAPLMTPLIAAGLALLQGNLALISSSARSIIFSFLISLLIGCLITLFLPISILTPELIARGGPTLIDMAIGLLSGMAAAYCLARPGLSAALPGVAIAAALVPPIAASGVSLALGEMQNSLGAALLFATNVVAVILGASFSFFACGAKGLDSPSDYPLWVRRTFTALIVAAMVLAIPLGLSLVSKLQH